MSIRLNALGASLILLLAAGSVGSVFAADWPGWRGPTQDGVSTETGLISGWSIDGENLIWRADLIGRSTPVVLDGRVCANGRVGEGITKQEVVACYDAGTGAKRWERRFNMFHTTVPFSRVGWADLAGDPETGNIYAQTVAGQLVAFDRGGKILWSRSLTEEFGRFSGYGGRTHSPIVDEDRVVIGLTNAGWGDQAAPRHRYFAFDKRTGVEVWVSAPAGPPRTMTTYSTPVVTEVKGRRLLIGGNSDGAVHALEARTGRSIWSFQLGKLGINTSVVAHADRVYATIGGEPIDEAVLGRVVGIDATGEGDVTSTHELWRVPGLKVGYASPLLHDGRLYVVDDSANLHALDAGTGATRWVYNLGTVGKGSPVWADGKLFATEVNGNFHILKPGNDGVTALDQEHLTVEGGRYAEIYGSPAVAYGRVYFSSEAGLFCLGDPGAPFSVEPAARPGNPEPTPGKPPAETIRIVPAEVVAKPGQTIQFRARAFDGLGRSLGDADGRWTLDGLAGSIDANGRLTADPEAGAQAGTISLKTGALTATARVRVYPDLPWTMDFESVPIGKNPAYWIGAGNRFTVQEVDGRKVLEKPFMGRGLERQNVYIGPSDMSGYTVQADLMGSKKGRRRPDMGLIAGRYTLDMQGNHQRLEIRDWAEPRLRRTIDFPWEPDTWYTMKMRVDVEGDTATIYGKAWKTSEPEPDAWTLSVEDPVPSLEGSPGLYGYSPVVIYYDNVKVTVSE